MRVSIQLASLVAGLALTACAGVNAPSGPPPSGSTAGPGLPPAQQLVGAIGGSSGNASAGQAKVTGADSQGEPAIRYSGPAGNIGSAATGYGSPTVTGTSSDGDPVISYGAPREAARSTTARRN